MFAIAKGSLSLLDRIGTATGKNYRVFSLEQVTRFVHWDLHANTLFAVWGVVLLQSERGVPMGGFISAQLMCLWALVREHTFWDDPRKDLLLTNVAAMWPRDWNLPQIKPGPP